MASPAFHLVLATLTLCAAQGSTEPAAGGPDVEVTAAGEAAWVLDDELDLLGSLQAELPWRLSPRSSIFLFLDTETAIRRSVGDLTFDVRELNYVAEVGLRRRLPGGRHLLVYAGQRGRERVDADGQPWIRYASAALESHGFREGNGGLLWRVDAGAVFDDREVRADAFLRARARLEPPPGSGWGGIGFDLAFDGLLHDREVQADVRLGPRLVWDLSSRHRLSVFLDYLAAEHPLGVDLSSLLVGFTYSERRGDLARAAAPPTVSGLVAAGGGEGREAGRLRLEFTSPPFERGGRFQADFDVNLLTARDTGELYYFYHLGYEQPAAGRLVGIYFHHRSNHQLAEPNDRITSINVIELGGETPGWRVPPATLPVKRWGRLDYRGRVGYLATSSFEERRRVQALGSVRWTLPWRGRRFAWTLLAEAEDGDVGRRAYAMGLTTRRGTGLQIEYRIDEQFFGRDRTAVLLLGERRF